VSERSETIEQLKREILQRDLNRRIQAQIRDKPYEHIPVADRRNPIPLAWAQQRLWFLDQLDKAAGAAYHLPSALRLIGRLDRAALRATLDHLVVRHEVLRTTFVTLDGEPVQSIAASAQFALAEHDLRQHDPNARAETVARRRQEEREAPFDLAVGPLIRGQLLQLADNEYILLVTQHHIVSDAWSTGVLAREVSALYSAFSQGRPDPLAALSIQYADYAAWQRQWLHGDVLQRQIEFWKKHLVGAPELLTLPTDRMRPNVQNYAGAAVPIIFSPEPLANLRQLSKRHDVTLFMTLLAGWSVLMARLSGQQDVVIGTPVANRQRAEIEPLIGFFVNTLALRVRLEEDPTVEQLLEQIKATTLEAYAHQDLPFEQVVEALNPPRSLSHSPVFQVVLTFNNTPVRDALSSPDLTIESLSAPQVTAQSDLTLAFNDSGDASFGSVEYASSLFDRTTIESFVGYLQHVLASMAFDPGCRISALPLLNDAQRRQLLVDFNATAVSYPTDVTLHGLFERQAAAHASEVALQLGDRELSYGELNRRANQVAHALLDLGARPDDRVALLVERGFEMLVGVLGILKAGCAYMPIDPADPVERQAYMLEDCGPRAVLTCSSLVDGDRLDTKLPVLMLDDPDGLLERHNDGNPFVSDLRPDHAAYVIYTSGSTGQPKGVINEHRAVVNRLLWARDAYAVTEKDRLLQKTPYTFDVSVWELLLPLLTGARLVLARPGGHKDPRYLAELIQSADITMVHFVPSMLQVFLDSTEAAVFPHLRRVLCSGEALPHALQLRVALHLPNVELHNLYGPTEAAIDVTAWHCRIGSATTEIVPIGRPIANTQIYILDAVGQPVPIGVTGEIHIGGAGVARGYLNRPELTAERFIADPFSSDREARLYKTGDLGRFRADGAIEYLGRNDFQVKIRGFRIELGEIEAALGRCAGVREAVVVTREDSTGDKRLVAYVVPARDAAPTVAELHSGLARALPEHMVPSAFVLLEEMPLGTSGKVDRKALPAPDAQAVVVRGYEAPVGEVEQVLAEVWQDLLGVPQVGRNDHFFELGGHSLLVVKLIERLRRNGLTADVRAIFMAPTLSTFAAAVREMDVALVINTPKNRIPKELAKELGHEAREGFSL